MKDKKNLIFLTFIGFLLVLGCSNSNKDTATTTDTNSIKSSSTPIVVKSNPDTGKTTDNKLNEISTESLEYKLASINKGFSVKEDDITVNRFRYLLENLEKKTQNTKQQIADMTVKAQQVLKEEYGKEISLLELMEQSNKAIPDNSNKSFKYEDIISMVMILLKE